MLLPIVLASEDVSTPLDQVAYLAVVQVTFAAAEPFYGLRIESGDVVLQTRDASAAAGPWYVIFGVVDRDLVDHDPLEVVGQPVVGNGTFGTVLGFLSFGLPVPVF